MINTRRNAYGVFTPAAVAPPTMLTPEQVLHHHHIQRRGGSGGQALCPPSSSPGLCISDQREKEFRYQRNDGGNQSLFFDVSFSMRPVTRSCAASLAARSRSIRIVSVSPPRQPGGRSDTGTFIRTDSSSQEISTATVPSIRSTVTFNSAPLQIAGQ
jgi:hypothetical protein